MTTLTTVILTYNKAWIFDRFLRSLLAQTRAPDNVVVVDDASTDGMDRILSRVPASWEVLRQRNNSGQSAARNAGFARVRGDCVIFLDADIEMEPDMLQTLEGALAADLEAGFAYGHYRCRGSRRGQVLAARWDPVRLRRGNFISTMCLVRRLKLPDPPFDPELRRYEDWDLWLRLARAGTRGVLVDRTLFTAFYRPEDLSGISESPEWANRVKAKHGLR